MDTTDDANNQASLLGAVHEGHKDLSSFFHITTAVYLREEARGMSGDWDKRDQKHTHTGILEAGTYHNPLCRKEEMTKGKA